MDLPCYSSPAAQDDFRKRIRESCKKVELSEPDLENVKILVPLTDNPNAPGVDDYTPIHEAAWNGYIEIVKILAPLTDNPNAPNVDGRTPSSFATNIEIIKILEFYTDQQNDT